MGKNGLYSLSIPVRPVFFSAIVRMFGTKFCCWPFQSGWGYGPIFYTKLQISSGFFETNVVENLPSLEIKITIGTGSVACTTKCKYYNFSWKMTQSANSKQPHEKSKKICKCTIFFRLSLKVIYLEYKSAAPCLVPPGANILIVPPSIRYR